MPCNAFLTLPRQVLTQPNAGCAALAGPLPVTTAVCSPVAATARKQASPSEITALPGTTWRAAQRASAFSVDASVGIHANDRQALERLLRYCARPCWASARLTQASDGEHLIYPLAKPSVDGSPQLILTPLELLDRLARFIPSPRRHRHRYHGAFAPHARLRAQVAARAGQPVAGLDEPPLREDLAALIRQGLGLAPQAIPAPPNRRSRRRLAPAHGPG